MAEVIWTDPALAELQAISEYIAIDNPEAARQLARSIFSAVDKLERFPKSGPRVSEFPKSAYRHLVIRPCRIIYRLEGNRVFIVFVLRGERLLREEFLT